MIPSSAKNDNRINELHKYVRKIGADILDEYGDPTVARSKLQTEMNKISNGGLIVSNEKLETILRAADDKRLTSATTREGVNQGLEGVNRFAIKGKLHNNKPVIEKIILDGYGDEPIECPVIIAVQCSGLGRHGWKFDYATAFHIKRNGVGRIQPQSDRVRRSKHKTNEKSSTRREDTYMASEHNGVLKTVEDFEIVTAKVNQGDPILSVSSNGDLQFTGYEALEDFFSQTSGGSEKYQNCVGHVRFHRKRFVGSGTFSQKHPEIYMTMHDGILDEFDSYEHGQVLGVNVWLLDDRWVTEEHHGYRVTDAITGLRKMRKFFGGDGPMREFTLTIENVPGLGECLSFNPNAKRGS
tara:strand:+ start:13603 stop:14664 length:1062 start_codon:yes stop_codon:yes gene_type:complete